MIKVFPGPALARLILCIAFGSASAAPQTIYLSCTVTGTRTVDDEQTKLSETVGVEVVEKPILSIALRGKYVGNFLSAEDIEVEGIRSKAISNRSGSDVWDLSSKTIEAGKRTYVSSVTINRVTGLLSYSREGTTDSGLSFGDRVAGTCTKQSRARKF